MREIKFRLWNKKYKGWMGDNFLIWGLTGELYHDDYVYFLTGGKFDKDDFELMQYTGLKDNKDKEIYEGDIVIVPSGPYAFQKGIIRYFEHWTGFRCDVFHKGEWGISLFGGGWEVIGNIYENQELLKNEKDSNCF